MKPSLQPGLTSVKRIPIDRDRTISFMGEDARVYATPSMIMDIERYSSRMLDFLKRLKTPIGRTG